jgi:recombination protein RecT
MTKNLIQQAVQSNTHTNKPAKPIEKLKAILDAESVKRQFQDVLKENAGAFVASIIDLYNTDPYLQGCDPKEVVMEALKAASLKLPINRQLGFAYIVPYRTGGRMAPTFQLGYKGYIQLCMRTGAYRYINADVVYEGELVKHDKLTGELELDPSSRISDKKIGYFAFLETLNGFRKTLFMTVEEVKKHAKKYSKSYGGKNSPWTTDFDAMALKTVLRLLLSKYGIMSIEMQQAFVHDVGPGVVEMADRKAEGTLDVEVHEVQEAIPEDATTTPSEVSVLFDVEAEKNGVEA